MSRIVINIKQSNQNKAKVSFECSQLEAGLIIKDMCLNHQIHINLDSRAMSMASLMGSESKP